MTDVEEFVIDPRIEKTVWKSLGLKPLKQIADETGLSRDQIIRIREELLSSVDDLTIMQKRQKLIISLEEMSQVARDDYDDAPYEFKAGILNSAISAIAKVQAELARMSKDDQGKIEALNAMRVRELLRLVDTTVNRTLGDIAEKFALDENELLGIFQSHLKPAAVELDTP